MITAAPILREAQQALDAGNQERAAYLTMQHLRQRPGDPRGLEMLGTVALKAGALLQAEVFFRQALGRGGPTMGLIRNLASCLFQQERQDEALPLFQAVAESRPDDYQVRANIVLIHDKLGREDEARRKWEQLVQEFPDKPSLWIAYAQHLRAAGQTEEAKGAYRRVISIEPDRGEAWWGLASIKTNRFDDDDIAAMERALGTASDILNLSPLHFALGRERHLRKEYAKAFHHFTEANRLWAQAINYNPDELTQEVSEASHMFDRDYFTSLRGGAQTSLVPVFIVSLPRSGSTLLEQMLGSHSEVEPLGELPYIPTLLRGVMERATQRSRTTVPQAVAALSAEQRQALGEDYLRRASLHRQTDLPYFIDKLPHNWNNVILIRHILPNAKFIDIRRSAIACCFANFSHSFTRAHSSSFALEHIGRAYIDYVRQMDHLDHAAPGLVHHVRYEQLIEDPERELRGALAYLGLPWDEACLRFYESDRAVRTPSAEQVRRPLNKEGIGAWKPYEQWLGPLKEVLGPLAEG